MVDDVVRVVALLVVDDLRPTAWLTESIGKHGYQ
jgi:hypothetical protein